MCCQSINFLQNGKYFYTLASCTRSDSRMKSDSGIMSSTTCSAAPHCHTWDIEIANETF